MAVNGIARKENDNNIAKTKFKLHRHLLVGDWCICFSLAGISIGNPENGSFLKRKLLDFLLV